MVQTGTDGEEGRLISKEQEHIEFIQKQMEEAQFQVICEKIAEILIPQIKRAGESISEKEGRPVVDNIIWRVKSSESIVHKLMRKEREISLDSAVTTLHDLMGIRVICPFQDDVFAVAKAIRKLEDLCIVNVKNYIIRPKSSGYRSIHVIARINREGLDGIFIEIQIRSVAMNYWAILEHQLCYKNSYEGAQKLQKELKSYAIAIADIDKKFLKLRKRIEKLEGKCLK